MVEDTLGKFDFSIAFLTVVRLRDIICVATAQRLGNRDMLRFERSDGQSLPMLKIGSVYTLRNDCVASAIAYSLS
jgi:hypothetical protein